MEAHPLQVITGKTTKYVIVLLIFHEHSHLLCPLNLLLLCSSKAVVGQRFHPYLTGI